MRVKLLSITPDAEKLIETAGRTACLSDKQPKRGSHDAQWEIRKVAVEVLKILKKHTPIVFEDSEIDEDEEVITKIEL